MEPVKSERRYLSVPQFVAALAAAKGQPVKTDDVTLLRPMHTDFKALGTEDSRLIEFIISDGSVDREQDTIDVAGWEFSDYQKNPVVLWAHDHYAPPIANARSVYTSGASVKSICEFMPKELDNGFSYMVYQMYVKRFMHAVSVGFQPIEYTFAEDRKYGINFKKQSLLEYSCVPVPANPNAIAVARSMGIDTAPLKAWAEQVLDDSTSKSLSDGARHRLEILRAQSTPEGRALILEIGGLKMSGKAEDVPATPPSDSTPKTGASADEVEVKRVVTEQWDCGESGHTHATEDDAKTCKRFDVMVIGVDTAIKGVLTLVKAGRVLSAANEERIRSAVTALSEVLSQLQTAEEVDDKSTTGVDKSGDAAVFVTESPEDDDGFNALMNSAGGPELLRSAIASATEKAINKAMGRVD